MHSLSLGSCFRPPVGLGVLRKPSQLLQSGRRVGVFPYIKVRLDSTEMFIPHLPIWVPALSKPPNKLVTHFGSMANRAAAGEVGLGALTEHFLT